MHFMSNINKKTVVFLKIQRVKFIRGINSPGFMKGGGIVADFINRVKRGLGQGISAANIKSREILEANKIKAEINDLLRQKKDVLEELGSIVYAMSRNDSFNQDRIREKCMALTALDEQIKEKNDAVRQIHLKAQDGLEKIKIIGVCACGAEIYPGIEFCDVCGRRV